MIDNLGPAKVDPITYSFNRMAATIRHKKRELAHPNTDLQKQMRARYELALCEIGEPPLPDGKTLRRAQAVRDYKGRIEESSTMRGEDWGIRIGPPAQ